MRRNRLVHVRRRLPRASAISLGAGMVVEQLEQRRLLSVSLVQSAADAPISDVNASAAPSLQISTSPQPVGSATTTTGTALTINSWAPMSNGGGTQMQWAWVNNNDESPEAAAERIAPNLISEPEGSRTVFLWQVLADAFTTSADQILAKGIDVSADQQWCQAFFNRLHDLGATVDRIATDQEMGLSVWVFFDGLSDGDPWVQCMQNFYSNPDIYAKMPQSVRDFQPSDYAHHYTSNGRAAINAWDEWTATLCVDALRQAVEVPAASAFGQAIPVSNFNDIAAGMNVADANGWPIAGDATSNVLSPALYLNNGQAYWYCSKDWRWNRLIDVINIIRACQNMTDYTTIPWISYPNFVGDNVPFAKSTWLWEQMMRHVVADGVSTFLYWNPTEVGSPDAMGEPFDAKLFEALSPQPTPSTPLPQISFDADEILTGGVVTTYADFLKYVDQPGASEIFPAPAPHEPEPANVLFANLSAGVLTVAGTSDSDTITIRPNGSFLEVVLNSGAPLDFTLSKVKRIEVNSGDGNDLIDFTSIGIPTYVNAGAGNDQVFAGSGNDTLTGGAGKDTLHGGFGNDRINGNGSADHLFGEDGNDRLYGGAGDDSLDGGGGVDRLYGGASADPNETGTGNDTLAGGSSNDKLYGQDGDDFLSGGKGADLIDGGAGNDTAAKDLLDAQSRLELLI